MFEQWNTNCFRGLTWRSKTAHCCVAFVWWEVWDSFSALFQTPSPRLSSWLLLQNQEGSPLSCPFWTRKHGRVGKKTEEKWAWLGVGVVVRVPGGRAVLLSRWWVQKWPKKGYHRQCQAIPVSFFPSVSLVLISQAHSGLWILPVREWLVSSCVLCCVWPWALVSTWPTAQTGLMQPLLQIKWWHTYLGRGLM